MTRSIDDLFGEALRREQRLLLEPWGQCDARQGYIDRAAHLRRLLLALGVELVQTGELHKTQITPDPIFSRSPIDGGGELLIRSDGGPKYSVLVEKDGTQKREIEFTVDSQLMFVDRILRRDRAVLNELKQPGRLTALAAYSEALRLHPIGVVTA